MNLSENREQWCDYIAINSVTPPGISAEVHTETSSRCVAQGRARRSFAREWTCLAWERTATATNRARHARQL